MTFSQEVEHKAPDGVDKEKNDANWVGDAMWFGKGVSKTARCTNVLLQEVTADY